MGDLRRRNAFAFVGWRTWWGHRVVRRQTLPTSTVDYLASPIGASRRPQIAIH